MPADPPPIQPPEPAAPVALLDSARGVVEHLQTGRSSPKAMAELLMAAFITVIVPAMLIALAAAKR